MILSQIAEWLHLYSFERVEIELNKATIAAFECSAFDGCAEPWEALSAEIDAECAAHAETERRPRQYLIVGFSDNGDRRVCPRRIRKCPTSGDAIEMVRTLSEQTRELHSTLMRERKESNRALVDMLEILTKRNEKLEQRASDVLDTLERLKTKQLERDMMVEREKASANQKERIVNALVPAALAVAQKVTGTPLLPAGDVHAMSLVEIARSMSEEQVGTISGILEPEQCALFGDIMSRALDGAADLRAFEALLRTMRPEQLMGVAQCLNMGQQAALDGLIHHIRGNNGGH
jgi:hypothetical protein